MEQKSKSEDQFTGGWVRESGCRLNAGDWVSLDTVLDDWGLAPLRDQDRRDLLEILEDRYGAHSTIHTSQLPVERRHDHLGEASVADAICDRLLHSSRRIALTGPSRRKEDSQLDD